MKFSIRLKLIVFTFCIVLLVGGSISLHSIYQGRQRVLTDFKKEALEATGLIAGIIADDLYFLDIRAVRDRLESTRANPDISYIYVMDLEGVVLSDGTKANSLRDQKLTDGFSQAMLRSDVWISQAEGEILKIGGAVLTPDGSRIGHLQVGFSLDPAYRIIRDTTKNSLYITVICLGIGVVLAFLLATSFSRPILDIVQASREIGDGQLDTRLRANRRDELGALAVSTNQMAEALQKRKAEAERKTQELQALYTLTNTINQSLNIDACMQTALMTTIEVLKVDAGRLYVLDEKDNVLRLTAHQGIAVDQLEIIEQYAPGEGIVGRIFADNRPIVFADISSDPNYQVMARDRWAQKGGYRSAAGLPITVKDRPVGVIYLYGKAAREFTPQDIALLSTIGNQIGVAIENSRLFEETKRNLEGIRALHEIDMAITSTLDLRDVLNVLLDKIDLFLPYSTATVRLFNKESGLLEPVACRNLDEEEWKAEEWRGGRGTPNIAFESKAPVMVSNVQTDPRNKDPEFFRKHGLVSYLGVPLIVQNEVLGVISFYTKEEHEYSSEEVEFLTTLAGQAAIAIHNSQVYEELAKLANDLSRSNRVKDEFLSVMSHELRTPLNVVMGYTGMIRDGLLGEINPEQEKALEKVIGRARDQLTMISSILQATQMEAEGVKVQRREVSLKDFLDDLRSSYSMPLGKELSLEWDYPSDLPVIHTDDEKLKHVLQNLINNAVKFTEKGHVTVSARYLNGARIGESSRQNNGGESPDGVVEMKVSDTGVGIAEEHLSVIFERFRQVDSSETRHHGGVGIGLYIVKKFTELLGGRVELESEPGKGSTFIVTLPCQAEREVSPKEGEERQAANARQLH